MTFVEIIVFLTLASLLFTISDVSKIKKENKKLKGEIEEIKKQILK